MRKLIRADTDRILRRKSLWILVAVMLALVGTSVIRGTDQAPDRAFAFAVTACDVVGNVGILIGLFLVLRVYTDDFKSMSFVNAIGRGISREKVILAKFLSMFLILVNVYLVEGLFLIILKFVLGVRLLPVEMLYLFLGSVVNIIGTTASLTIASVFFFLTDNTVIGMLVYLCAEVIIPIVLELVSSIAVFARIHLERLYYTGAAGSMMSDFMMGMTGAGLLKLLLIIVIYIGGALAACMLLFRKKELSF